MPNQSTERLFSDKHVLRSAVVKERDGLTRVLARQEAEARGNMYRFLAAVYLRPPNEHLLERVVDPDFLGELSSLFGVRAVAELSRFSATARPDQELASLRQEYMDLFAVPTGRYVTPFEDVYRGGGVGGEEGKPGKGPLMGKWAIAARRMYREAGAQKDESCTELPNHIGIELAFMDFLCAREAKAYSRGEGADPQSQERPESLGPTAYHLLQIRFLQEHLTAWFPELSVSIQANAKSRFYRWIAQITEEFLVLDTAGLLSRSVVLAGLEKNPLDQDKVE